MPLDHVPDRMCKHGGEFRFIVDFEKTSREQTCILPAAPLVRAAVSRDSG
jgi:hypothetical protein